MRFEGAVTAQVIGHGVAQATSLVEAGVVELRGHVLGENSPEAAGAPTTAMVEAASALIKRVSTAERERMCFPVDSGVWQQWQNTENYVEILSGLQAGDRVALDARARLAAQEQTRSTATSVSGGTSE